MSNWVIHPSRGTVRFCYAERDARKEVSIFVTLAPDLTEPSRLPQPCHGGIKECCPVTASLRLVDDE